MAQHFTLEVNTQQVRSNAEDLRTEAQAYHSASQQLLEDGRTLAASWEGEAKKAFEELLERDTPEFLTLYTELNAFCDAAIESANLYDTTQSNIASEMRSARRN